MTTLPSLPRLDRVRPLVRNGIADLPLWFKPSSIAMSQWRALLTSRGADTRFAPLFGVGGAAAIYPPRTTNGDIVRIAIEWSGRLAAIVTQLGKPLPGLDRPRARWRATVDEITRATAGVASGALYAHNDRVWAAIAEVAIDLDAFAPDTATGALGVSVRVFSKVAEYIDDPASLPEHVAEGLALAADKATEALGDVAGSVWDRVQGALLRPLIYVGGGLAGLYLLTHTNRGTSSTGGA